MASPEQEIFSAFRKLGMGISGWKAYDHLPGKDTIYPFLFIGEEYGGMVAVKAGRMGHVNQTVHFYSNNPHKRGDMSAAMEDFVREAMELTQTRSFYIDCSDYRMEMVWDASTGTPLMHGILEFTVNYSRR